MDLGNYSTIERYKLARKVFRCLLDYLVLLNRKLYASDQKNHRTILRLL